MDERAKSAMTRTYVRLSFCDRGNDLTLGPILIKFGTHVLWHKTPADFVNGQNCSNRFKVAAIVNT